MLTYLFDSGIFSFDIFASGILTRSLTLPFPTNAISFLLTQRELKIANHKPKYNLIENAVIAARLQLFAQKV